MSDIRIEFSLIGHPKLEKLKRLIGDQALERLVTLWVRVAQNRPKGNLSGLDNIDIAIYAGWTGDSDEFVEALKDCKWIKDNGNGFEIQDWEEHQPWIYSSKERSERARKAALARWLNNQDADVMQDACETHKESNPPTSPSPKPKPNPSPRRKKKPNPPNSVDDVIKFFKENGYSKESAINAFEYYKDQEPPWHDAEGKPVLSWKSKMRVVWFKPENKYDPTKEFI